MALTNSHTGWGLISRSVHWGMAAVMLFMSALGLYMTNAFAPGDLASYSFYQMHKSWGFVVFALALLRVIWHLLHRTRPDLPKGMAGWERAASRATHAALYVLIFAIPLTGWLMISASTLQDMGIPNKVFGSFDFPDPFVPGNAAIADTMKALHGLLWYALVAVLGLHVGGALKHHFISRDTVLRRMLRGS